MDEITINTANQTPIEIALGIDKDGYTTARALYDFLEMPSQNFARWAKKNIEENEYFEENTDWWGFFTMKNGNKCKDYRLTTDFAKHLSMESHSAKGKIARQYFLKVEDKLKESIRHPVPMTIPEQIQLLAQGNVELNKRIDDIQTEFETLKMDLPILPIEAEKITEAVKRKGTLVLGGKESNAYNSRSIRQKVYSNIHSNLRYQFQVKSYKAIKRSQVEQAVKIIGEYKPPVFLKNEIDTENAQQRFF
nr:MAG TPA: hypothetical protein [Caudoviricetes sp.]